MTPEDLGVDITSTLETVNVEEPPKRVGGGKVKDVPEVLIDLIVARCEA